MLMRAPQAPPPAPGSHSSLHLLMSRAPLLWPVFWGFLELVRRAVWAYFRVEWEETKQRLAAEAADLAAKEAGPRCCSSVIRTPHDRRPSCWFNGTTSGGSASGQPVETAPAVAPAPSESFSNGAPFDGAACSQQTVVAAAAPANDPEPPTTQEVDASSISKSALASVAEQAAASAPPAADSRSPCPAAVNGCGASTLGGPMALVEADGFPANASVATCVQPKSYTRPVTVPVSPHRSLSCVQPPATCTTSWADVASASQLSDRPVWTSSLQPRSASRFRPLGIGHRFGRASPPSPSFGRRWPFGAPPQPLPAPSSIQSVHKPRHQGAALNALY